MAATLSSANAWTTQLTTFPSPSDRNTGTLDKVHQDDLRTTPSEVDQMVKLVAAAYSTSYWAACAWLRAQLTALASQQTPTT